MDFILNIMITLKMIIVDVIVLALVVYGVYKFLHYQEKKGTVKQEKNETGVSK